MANFFDQFDPPKPAAKTPNFFDQFDEAPAAAPVAPAAPVAAPAAPAVSPASAAAGGPVPEDPTWMDAIMSVPEDIGRFANFGARGVAEGVTKLATLPQALGEGINSLAQYGLEAGGAPQSVVDAAGYMNPLGYLWPSEAGVNAVGDKVNSSVASMFGVEPPREANTVAERVTQRVGQEIGAAAVPTLGVLGKYAGKGLAAAKEAPAIARFFGAEAAAVNPAAYLAKEGSFAAAAGMGAAGANEVFPDSQIADFAGAVGGAGALGIGSSVARSASDIGRAFFGNGSYADEVVRDAVMRDVAAGAGIQAAPGDAPDLTPIINATEGPRVSDTIPGYQESLADRTKIPGIAAMEYSRQSGPNAGVYTAQRQANTQAVDNAMAPLEPNATPGQFSAALNETRADRLGAASDQVNQAKTAFDNATRSLMPTLTGEGRGANIRTALQDASAGAREILQKAWEPINSSTQPVDMETLRAAFGNVDQNLSVAETQRFRPKEADIPGKLVEPGTPPAPTGILDANGKPIMRPGEAPNGQQPLNEITGIRSALTDAQREAASAGRNNEARIIGQYIDGIDGYMKTSLPEDLRQQYDTARTATRDFNDRFNRPQTAIGQTLAEREGQPRYPDSTVAGKFVQDDQGRIADFEALMKEAGNDGRVQSAVRDQILQDVRDRGLMENPQALNDYLGQYGTVFGKFPALKDELGNAGALRKNMEAATQTEQQLRTTLTQQGKSNVANYLSYGDEKADQAMKGVLASRDPAASIDELISFVGDEPKAVEGARKVFWDIMQGKTRAGGRTTMNVDGSQPWSPKALSDFLDNPTNAAVAERLYRDNPEHLTRIREISDALKGVDTRNAAKAPNTSGTPQGMQSQLLTPEALQSRAYAYMSGRISGTFLVTSIASVLVRRGVRKAQEQGYQRMMDDILTNADTAALMMRENNPANRQALARKAKGWYGNEASTLLNAMSADDSNEETDAITREKE